jgi:hypothetical protein
MWHIGQRPLAYWVVMAAICQRSYNPCANCQHSPFCFLRELPTAALAVRATVVRPLSYRGCHSMICQVSKIRRIWRTNLYIEGCSIVRTVALWWAVFKRKKGFPVICLGLIYHSMVLLQLPPRDTVPLRHINVPKCFDMVSVLLNSNSNFFFF